MVGNGLMAESLDEFGLHSAGHAIPSRFLSREIKDETCF